MTNNDKKIQNIENYIEHTILKPNATYEEVKKLLNEAIENKFLGVCINPFYIESAKSILKGSNVKLVTVIGFPLGTSISDVKSFETQRAIEHGADEIDMVINIGALKDGAYEFVEQDVQAVVDMAETIPVKVILETDFLTKDEIITACKICANAGAKFVKTSTGFAKGGVGATAENIKIMADTVRPFGLQVKASAGITNAAKAIEMIEAGATRIGTSSGVSIVKEFYNEV